LIHFVQIITIHLQPGFYLIKKSYSILKERSIDLINEKGNPSDGIK